MAMNGVWLVRVVALGELKWLARSSGNSDCEMTGVLLLFSIIEMALSAAYIAKLNDFALAIDTPSWAGLALAISLITLITVAPLSVVFHFSCIMPPVF